MSAQEQLYVQAVDGFGAALERLVRAYEADPDKRRDLLQEIHLALWRSFAGFESRCSLRTWVYRVAHNTATSHVIRQNRTRSRELLTLRDLETASNGRDTLRDANDRMTVERLLAMIHRLKPLERDVMLLRRGRRDLIARTVFAAVAALFCGVVVWNTGTTVTGLIATVVMSMLVIGALQNVQRAHARSLEVRRAGVHAETALKTCLAHYRSELQRQKQLRSQPAWQPASALLIVVWLIRRSLFPARIDALHILLPAVLVLSAGLLVL